MMTVCTVVLPTPVTAALPVLVPTREGEREVVVLLLRLLSSTADPVDCAAGAVSVSGTTVRAPAPVPAPFTNTVATPFWKKIATEVMFGPGTGITWALPGPSAPPR